MQQIPRRNKDLAFGYVKQSEKKHKSTIPDMIKYLCLLFLNSNKDQLMYIIHQNGYEWTVVSSVKTLLIGMQITPFFGKCRKHKDSYLKVQMRTSKKYLHSDQIGIWKVNYGDPIVEIGHCFFDGITDIKDKAHTISVGYGLDSRGNLSNPMNAEVAGREFATEWKKNDIIEMKLDFNKLELSFKINEKDYGKAFDIEDTKYRAAITFAAQSTKSGYTLISYSEIY